MKQNDCLERWLKKKKKNWTDGFKQNDQYNSSMEAVFVFPEY